MAKACQSDIFTLLGPNHLTKVDWSNPVHTRSVMASLVMGVYRQEEDRTNTKQGENALEEMWWSFFGFELAENLQDKEKVINDNIFGSVYQWTGKNKSIPPPGAPKVVVALRGTLLEPNCAIKDILHDLLIISNDLHTTGRYKVAFDVVKNLVDKHGVQNVWLTGHSLGAFIAILVGRNMAGEYGHFLPTHLFNPPFISFASILERCVQNEKLRKKLQMVGEIVGAGLAGLAFMYGDKPTLKEAHEAFLALGSWVPCLYVNKKDSICFKYIGHFATQEKMRRQGLKGLADLRAKQSATYYVVSKLFTDDSKKMSPHLFPSANVIENLNPAKGFINSHSLCQWWAQDLETGCTQYRLCSPQVQDTPKT